jgi:hypothetical protein
MRKVKGRGKEYTNIQKLNQNILMITDVFLNQKRVNACEHTAKIMSLEFLKGVARS